MARVSISSLEQAPVVELPAGFAGNAETTAFFDRDKDPLHVHLHRLRRDAALRVGPKPTDCEVYVWKGTVEAGGRLLAAGSSLIVERGATSDIMGRDSNSELLTFSAARPSAGRRSGGHVHLLPADRVPRAAVLAGTAGVGGGMHANAACPTCQVWLHENSFPPAEPDPADPYAEKGIHSHSEDEVIFVTDGHMRLGARLCGPGTAIAIAADTLYSFGVGSDGLKFVNFRAGLPSEIKFKGGGSMDEVAYWRDRVASPDYLAPLPA